ncbi:MAG: hypothetical protein IKG14_06215 [Clostridia bacterium]|nr:hypothetical protein [Clostridia bacterium]
MYKDKINILELDDFKKKYRSAYYTLKQEKNNEFLELLNDTYNDDKQMHFIRMANDYLEYAPVYSWLIYNKEKIERFKNNNNMEKFSTELKQALGAFWGWVMQYDPVNNISIKWRNKYNKTTKQKMRKKTTIDFKTATIFKYE